MLIVGLRRARDLMVVVGLAIALALGFTTALSGGADPDYALHPHDIEIPQDVLDGVSCEGVELALELFDTRNASSEDREHERDLRRAGQRLGCDD